MIGDLYGGCSGKKKFTSYYSAARSAKKLNRFVEHSRANPYRCDRCHFFHVGNTLGKMKHKRDSRHTLKEKYRNGRIKLPN